MQWATALLLPLYCLLCARYGGGLLRFLALSFLSVGEDQIMALRCSWSSLESVCGE